MNTIKLFLNYSIGAGEDANGTKLNRTVTQVMEKAAELACHAFGGASVTQGFGSWKDDSGNIISEPAVFVQVLTDLDLMDYEDFLLKNPSLNGDHHVTYSTYTEYRDDALDNLYSPGRKLAQDYASEFNQNCIVYTASSPNTVEFVEQVKPTQLTEEVMGSIK